MKDIEGKQTVTYHDKLVVGAFKIEDGGTNKTFELEAFKNLFSVSKPFGTHVGARQQ